MIDLSELWDQATSRDLARGVFMVVRAYIDESYNENVFAIGYAIAKGVTWGRASSDWRKCIGRKNRELKSNGRPLISRYKAADCNGQHSEYEGWQKDESAQLTSELVAALSKHHIHFVGYTIDTRDIYEVFPEVDNFRPVAYRILAVASLWEVARQAKCLDQKPRVTVFYDKSPFDKAFQKSYDCMSSNWYFKDREIFDGIKRQDRTESMLAIPFDVADLIAHEAMQERKRLTIGKARRVTFENLLLSSKCHGGRGNHFGLEGLKQFRNRFESFLNPSVEYLQ